MLAFFLCLSWGSRQRFARTPGSVAASFLSDQGRSSVPALAGVTLRGAVLRVARVNEHTSVGFSGFMRHQESS